MRKEEKRSAVFTTPLLVFFLSMGRKRRL